MGERLAVFPTAMTEAVCNVVAATDYPALSTSELERVLSAAKLGLEDGPNKRTRLLITLNNAQVTQHAGNVLIVFLNAAMHPSRYVSDPSRFAQLQGQLNEVLILFGFRVNDKGQFARAPKVSTLGEAAQLSGELVAELRRRACHPVLLAYCDEELLRKSLFHAIQEAAKSIPDRLRRHAGLGTDGEDLYAAVFGGKVTEPLVTMTPFQTESEKSEHRGFKTLLTGIHGHYRNPRAHATRLGSDEDKQDFFEAFALFSYVHRRLDRADVAR
ncbi:TIGR02391 family protein [Aeromicrobium sp. 9AM]|uniref:TIGR02391 family protein n=1 Tax=Aeromicrobium sp. 9AM TaxID=2653126 RepID=UPI0012F1F983|nr:TIGR02391 family protein [Aeromicrobium sp. 9AM]VXB04649.1 conserved hypothetical protein [Aeromicrobium sp. 9AM]